MNTDVVSLLALITSIVALLWTAIMNRRQNEYSTLLAHLSDINAVEARLGQLPSALRFHGLSESDLADGGMTPEEYAYLLNNFTAGATWHMILTSRDRSPFRPGSYRYVMCQSVETQKAWPVVKRMMSPSGFVERIDATIALIQRSANQPTS